jgi:hypothetical protein
MTSTFNIRRGGESDLPSLEPLWVAVHHRHVESMPQLAPYVDDVTTWVQRSELYRELLAKPRHDPAAGRRRSGSNRIQAGAHTRAAGELDR